MSESMEQVAQRIQELRESSDLTMEEMARELNVPPAIYEGYEATGENIPISVVYHISQKFGVDMTEILTGRSARLDTFVICRRGKGETISRTENYVYENLAHRFTQKIMEPMLVTLQPTYTEATMLTHRGQEFNLVLEGTIELTYDTQKILLYPGDSIYFDPTHPHGQKAVGPEKARFLTVIVE